MHILDDNSYGQTQTGASSNNTLQRSGSTSSIKKLLNQTHAKHKLLTNRMKQILANSSNLNNLEQELTVSGQLYKDQYEYLKKKLAYHDQKLAAG